MRGLGVILALGLALAVLAWGLLNMHGIFLEERQDALAAIASQRHTLEQYAHKELEQRLQSRLAEAQPTIDAAATDPLLPGAKVLLVDRGQQLLPRTEQPKTGSEAPAGKLLTELLGDEPELVAERAHMRDPGSPWAERVQLFLALRAALQAGDRDGIERGVRGMLGHRASFVVTSRKDIPLTIATLSLLSQRAAPKQTFMASMLREGLSAGPSKIDGLQRALLRQRPRFTRADMKRLGSEITRLSEAHQVLFSDFAARLDDPPAQSIALPDQLDAPVVLAGGQWYVAAPRQERIRGIHIDVMATLGEISSTMRDRALIDAGDEVVGQVPARSLPVQELALSVRSPRWQPAIDAVHSRYRLKALLEVLIALLCFGLMGAGWLTYRRKQRFLELKGEFVSAVSHELRTPLASIRLMAETLERKTRGLTQVRDYPSRIVRDVDGLSVLVENILSFNRLSRGRWEPKLDKVPLREVMDKLAEERDGWERRTAELSYEGIDEVVLRADRELLQLLLTNLLRNACTYNEREPVQIAVSAQQQSGWRLQVQDNGTGIDPEQRERIFDDFYRGVQGGARGSGLGLALCRKIMNAHGGRVLVSESGPQGSTFELHFPAHE